MGVLWILEGSNILLTSSWWWFYVWNNDSRTYCTENDVFKISNVFWSLFFSKHFLWYLKSSSRRFSARKRFFLLIKFQVFKKKLGVTQIVRANIESATCFDCISQSFTDCQARVQKNIDKIVVGGFHIYFFKEINNNIINCINLLLKWSTN